MSRVEQALRRANVTSQESYLIVDDEPVAAPPPPRPSVLFEAPESVVRPAPIAPTADVLPFEAMSEKLVTAKGFDTVAIEEYRKLAAALHQMQLDHGTRSVMVTSTLSGEGKTMTAVNLAVTLSESFHRRVLLIDADLRRPSAHAMFKVANDSGLSNELDSDGKAESLIELSPRLTLLPGGPSSSDPMSKLTSARMQQVIEEAIQKFDWVILDAPPVLAMPDASLLARMLDVIVFLVRAARTPNRSIQRAMSLIDRTKIAGVVLNRVEEGRTVYGYAAPR